MTRGKLSFLQDRSYLFCQLGGQIHHWRDSNQNEIDLIVTLADGTWAGFEIKMNPDDADKAAGALLRFAGKVDQHHNGRQTALGVITTTGFAYRRDDGVLVLPIGTLGPWRSTLPDRRSS